MSKVPYIKEGSICPTIFDINIKYIDGIIKKFIPNLSIDEEITLWGNKVVLFSVIYHEGEQSDCRHYTSGFMMENTWFLICDTKFWGQQKLQCNSRNIIVTYILFCKKRSNRFLTSLSSLNDNGKIGPTSDVISEASEILIRQSALKELEK